ncbi:MAG: YifB family Mg chelatase-like AAA ATPase [Bacteroidota bacterium]
MLAKVPGGAVLGIDGYPVSVEVDVSAGLPSFEVVGLPDAAIREARERVRAALRNSGFEFPLRRITVNLAPAMIRKEGACFDLAIALGILAATGEISPSAVEDCMFAGELSLDGQVRGTSGVLSIALAAKSAGFTTMMVANENAGEAALVDGIDVYGVSTLAEAVGHLSGALRMNKAPATKGFPDATPETAHDLDFADVLGQEHARRALEVAAAGGHNVLMVGPPGAGKTMLARRMPSILPPLTWEEALEVTRVYSAAGLLPTGSSVVSTRPFRNPHHTISAPGLIGGGRVPRPGEISLAHRGVLFLDEIPEFAGHALEALRQPLEDGFVTVSRAGGMATFPARFMLVAAMNPCPCGRGGAHSGACTCTPPTVRKYLARLSGPLLDRIDLHIHVRKVDVNELEQGRSRETSAEIRERVMRARRIQQARFAGLPVRTNAEMRPAEIRAFCRMSRDARTLLYTACARLGLSARAHARVLKVARTIADLEGGDLVQDQHISEAVSYRAFSLRG